MESLVYSGSMDSLEGSRAQNLDAVDIAIKYGQKIQQEVDKNQVDLFGTGESQNELIKTPTLGNSEEWSEKEALSKEVEVLGLYVSGHPLLEHADDLEEFTTISFDEDQQISKNDMVTIGGMITRIVKRFDRFDQPPSIEAVQDMLVRAGDAAPSFPISDSKKWVEFVLNQMIKKATADGLDSIAVTNGQIQINHYRAHAREDS